MKRELLPLPKRPEPREKPSVVGYRMAVAAKCALIKREQERQDEIGGVLS